MRKECNLNLSVHLMRLVDPSTKICKVAGEIYFRCCLQCMPMWRIVASRETALP